MTREEQVEDLAYNCALNGAPRPEFDKSSELLLFLSFRNLYEFAFRTQMKPDQGKKEKAQIRWLYEAFKNLEELQESTNSMWKRIELAVSDYNKSPSIEKADKIIEAMYGAKRRKNDIR